MQKKSGIVWGWSLKNDLGGGFKYFLCSSLFGEIIQFDEHIFQVGKSLEPTRSSPFLGEGKPMS